MRLRTWEIAPLREVEVQSLSQYRGGLTPAPTTVRWSVALCGRITVAVDVGAGFKPALAACHGNRVNRVAVNTLPCF